MDNQSVTIRALKYGDHAHYEWTTKLLERTDTHIIVLGEWGRELRHHTKNKLFIVENWTIEFFSFYSWFTVSADVVGGKIAQYYCNISQPAQFLGNAVCFVDLDLDLVYRNGQWTVVDEDELAENAVKFGYPAELTERARAELVSLQNRIQESKFPFDGTLERWICKIPQTTDGGVPNKNI